jgi:hypothetical protein
MKTAAGWKAALAAFLFCASVSLQAQQVLLLGDTQIDSAAPTTN